MGVLWGYPVSRRYSKSDQDTKYVSESEPRLVAEKESPLKTQAQGEFHQWKGYVKITDSFKGVIKDDDDTLDGSNDVGQNEVLEIDGQDLSITYGYQFGMSYKTPSGETGDVNLLFLSTEKGWFFTPMKGEELLEGSTLTGFNSKGYKYLGGVQYDDVLCFVPGAMITTLAGPRPVETLRPGDKVLTADNGFQELLWTGLSILPLGAAERLDVNPVQIRAGTLAPGVPERDIWLSPQHRILLRGPEIQLSIGEPEAFASARALSVKRGIQHCRRPGPIEYVHLLFAQHEVLFANGAMVESFFPDPRAMQVLTPKDQIEVNSVLGHEFGGLARPVIKPWEVRGMLHRAA